MSKYDNVRIQITARDTRSGDELSIVVNGPLEHMASEAFAAVRALGDAMRAVEADDVTIGRASSDPSGGAVPPGLRRNPTKGGG